MDPFCLINVTKRSHWIKLKKILFTCFWFDVRNKCIYYRSKDTRHVISSTNTKLINKRDFSPPKMSQTLKKLLINITGNHYRLIAVKLHFLMFKTYSLNVS